jgi:Putative Zn-dependent protease, contains TPR repeats
MKTVLALLLLFQNPADLYKAAVADMENARWAEAAATFEKVLRDDPGHIPTEFNLAVCYTKLEKLDEAKQLYRKIVEQDASMYEAVFNLGLLQLQSGEDKDAEQQFKTAATIRPDDPDPVLYQARIFEKAGDKTNAAEAYERAAQLKPNNPDIRIAAITFYLNTQQIDRAYAQFQALQPPVPTDSDLRRRLGAAFRAAKNLDKALEVLAPLGSGDNLELALVYFDLKQYEKAGAVFTLLTEKEPNNPDYLYMLGKCQFETKQYTKAVPTLQRALKLNPEDIEAYSTLGTTYYFLEDWPNAIVALERFAKARPRTALVYFLIATSYDKLGNVPLALVNYNKFLELDDGSNDARSFQARQRAKTLERRRPGN